MRKTWWKSTREVIRQAFPATPPTLPAPPEGYPLVILVVGVNGTGKTTSAAELGHILKEKQGGKVLLELPRTPSGPPPWNSSKAGRKS